MAQSWAGKGYSFDGVFHGVQGPRIKLPWAKIYVPEALHIIDTLRPAESIYDFNGLGLRTPKSLRNPHSQGFPQSGSFLKARAECTGIEYNPSMRRCEVWTKEARGPNGRVEGL